MAAPDVDHDSEHFSEPEQSRSSSGKENEAAAEFEEWDDPDDVWSKSRAEVCEDKKIDIEEAGVLSMECSESRKVTSSEAKPKDAPEMAAPEAKAELKQQHADAGTEAELEMAAERWQTFQAPQLENGVQC